MHNFLIINNERKKKTKYGILTVKAVLNDIDFITLSLQKNLDKIMK